MYAVRYRSMSWRWFLKIENEATTCKPSDTCQPLPVFTQVMSRFGEQREVHENTNADRRLNGAAEWNQPDAFKM